MNGSPFKKNLVVCVQLVPEQCMCIAQVSLFPLEGHVLHSLVHLSYIYMAIIRFTDKADEFSCIRLNHGLSKAEFSV